MNSMNWGIGTQEIIVLIIIVIFLIAAYLFFSKLLKK
ncbi:Uncharacterised protein [Sphingobacterium multivorum]|jgi:hypothetical protein|uniref:Uncharacterized protein n=1 Tax=Sphingobacterium multivorum TaxID=28454 RepID=A0A2X2IPB0_SPHMU|nr:Uncharacterised protein [Sphingobacterium multivorum]SUJ11145.1 Uncharacterised protein [Sphingobacterium multivorum]